MMLQWGRGGEAAERQQTRFLTSSPYQLQWGRGGEAAESSLECLLAEPAEPRFNGAAAVRPRKVRRLSKYSDCPTRFNGAAAVRPRKGYGQCCCTQAQGASMGPRR